MLRNLILKEISKRLDDDCIQFVMQQGGALKFKYRFGDINVTRLRVNIHVDINFYLNTCQGRFCYTVEEIEESRARFLNAKCVWRTLDPFKLLCCYSFCHLR